MGQVVTETIRSEIMFNRFSLRKNITSKLKIHNKFKIPTQKTSYFNEFPIYNMIKVYNPLPNSMKEETNMK